MEGPEHYVQAEMLLNVAGYRDATDLKPEAPNARTVVLVNAAQVHATLALAAATAANIRRNGAVEAVADGWADVLKGES
jgi:hypothetical protein